MTSPSYLNVNVRQLVAEVTDPEDEGMQGVYQVDFVAEALDMSLAKRAAIALDVFHYRWGIETLDDFDIVVFDSSNVVVEQDPEHEDYSGTHLGAVEKISDTPVAVRPHPAHDMLADVELCILAAQEHGENSEPDHEVGDLQDCLREMWALLTPAQRASFMCSDTVRERLDNELDETLVETAYARTGYDTEATADASPSPSP